jgi:hypothetical protein
MFVFAHVSSMKTSRYGVEIRLPVEPGPPARQDVGTVLLAGLRRLFCA